MIDDLFLLSRHFLKTFQRDFKRYFLQKHKLDNRFSIITGPRGVGKTTAIIQYILQNYGIQDTKALYLPVDHFSFGKRQLFETAEEFSHLGGELICFDEIHKFPDWARQLKSIYDSFPKLKIIASGSSALQIEKASHDLSRRAVVFKMTGLSFREFIDLKYGIQQPVFQLEYVLNNHEDITTSITTSIEKQEQKVLALFQSYLQTGYYPYFLEYPNPELYFIVLEQSIHTTIESDLIMLSPALTGVSIQKIKKLLSIIAASVPFTPDLKKLKQLIEVGDERTLKTYLKYLEDGGIIINLNRAGKGLRQMEKPGKIYMNNPNQMYAISSGGAPKPGTIREIFFLNMLGTHHSVTLPIQGDFLVDDSWLFEIGGKNKGFDQIKNQTNAYLALDNIENGIGRKIPLWLFGFLY